MASKRTLKSRSSIPVARAIPVATAVPLKAAGASANRVLNRIKKTGVWMTSNNWLMVSKLITIVGLLIFAISWMGSRDILIALALTAIFNVLANHLFNEDSKFCIVPMKYRNYENILDLNGDGKVSEDELKKAKDLIKKADVKEKRREHLKMLNNFKLSV